MNIIEQLRKRRLGQRRFVSTDGYSFALVVVFFFSLLDSPKLVLHVSSCIALFRLSFLIIRLGHAKVFVCIYSTAPCPNKAMMNGRTKPKSYTKVGRNGKRNTNTAVFCFSFG